MAEWIYFRLLDEAHRNMIVRAKGREQEMYDAEKKVWLQTGILLHYFSDDSDRYDMYEEIAEVDVPEAM